MTIMTAPYFDSIKDYAHPNVNKFILLNINNIIHINKLL